MEEHTGDTFVYLNRKCKICRVATVRGKRVNCSPCITIQKKKKEARKAERQEWLNYIHGKCTAQAPIYLSDDGENTVVASSSSSSSTSRATLNDPISKPGALLKDLKGYEREAAMRLMKMHVDGMVRKRGPCSDPTRYINTHGATEYQTADELYTALEALTLEDEYVDFHGVHTIIASSDIDQKKRLKLVVKALASLGLPFEPDQPIKRQRTPDGKLNNIMFECICGILGSGNMMSWKGEVLKKGNGEDCGGRIRITVKADSESHPLGILGDMITVKIGHP